MARTYVRDNRGRFASSGATARGGRLKTASGAKRKGSTMRAAGGAPAGAMKGRVKRDPGAAGKMRKATSQRPASKLGFTLADFSRRSQRTAGVKNPEIRAKAQRLYGRVMDTGSTPRQLRSMFKKAGKPKAGAKSAESRRRAREHADMLKLSGKLFR